MLFLTLYFVLFLVLIFQGTHVAGEVKTPLGTLPAEVGQNPVASARWGILLIAVGFLGIALGLLGFRHPAGDQHDFRPALFVLGLCVLALYGLWVIFLGRRPEFIGKPADDHGHGHH